MKILDLKQSTVSERDRAHIPEYEWDRMTHSARFKFLNFRAGTAWVDLSRNEREHVACEADFRWEESKLDPAPVRYRLKITAVRLSRDTMRVEQRKRHR